MRVVVVGASGNTGTALLDVLEGDRTVDEVVGVVRRVPSASLGKLSWVRADITRDDLVPIFEGADAVVHLAWLIQPSHDRGALDAVNVDGTDRVLRAVAAARVPAFVFASSVGAYSPGPRDGSAVGEGWPTLGIRGNLYSQQKAQTERMLDAFEAAYPAVRVVRMRPALVFQRAAAAHVKRLFLGPLVPRGLLAPGRVPFVPAIPGLQTQCVHAVDLADAYRRAIVDPAARGAYNVATEPTLDAECMARALRTRTVPMPRPLAWGVAALTWRARLQPIPPSWLDLALDTPLMSSARARAELGWMPRIGATHALGEIAEGIATGAGGKTPPLALDADSRVRDRTPVPTSTA